MANINLHPLVKQAYELCIAIEECGFGEKLTAASVKASELTEALSRYFENQRPFAAMDTYANTSE